MILLGYRYLADEVWLFIFLKMKVFDLVNVSGTCKRFFMIRTAHKKFRQTVSISKPIFNFDNYYDEFLHNQMLDLKVDIQKKFEEEISSEIFSIISLKNFL